ncbi:MAG: hypothetical protein CM15mV18_0760 [uncultured marine virus]|nr:MAG: hypothetical protein CM15mV18_0760 [uncultured marine virus]
MVIYLHISMLRQSAEELRGLAVQYDVTIVVTQTTDLVICQVMIGLRYFRIIYLPATADFMFDSNIKRRIRRTRSD